MDNSFIICSIIFLITITLTVLLTRFLIPILSRIAQQPIYKDGPVWHMSKSGTPTMGGVGFAIAVLISLSIGVIILFSSQEKYFAMSLSLSLIYGILNAMIGIIDDFTKLRRKRNSGLSPKQKLLLQSFLAIGLILSRVYILSDSTKLYFHFGSVDLGWAYYILSFLVLLGTVNCANLTDGIDGLAAGVAFAIGLSLFYISYSASTDISLVASALIGASLGFLIFNINPAKIFMGDTGSLFFGSIIGAVALSLGNFLIIAFIGIVYLIEGISVILQVVFFKLTGKRIFKMAPIHHHFEKCGWSENKIVLSAIFLTLLVSIPAFILFI